MVERASPEQQRKALEIAHLFAKMGIGFVPVPVTSNAEFEKMAQQTMKKLAELHAMAEQLEKSE